MLFENIFDRQRPDHDAGTAEEGVDLGQGVLGVVEGDEEADGALLAGKITRVSIKGDGLPSPRADTSLTVLRAMTKG